MTAHGTAPKSMATLFLQASISCFSSSARVSNQRSLPSETVYIVPNLPGCYGIIAEICHRRTSHSHAVPRLSDRTGDGESSQRFYWCGCNST